MYCPRCGQQQVNEDTRFCSRCGFLMQGMRGVIANGGLPKTIVEGTDPNAVSPRRRGIRQGGILMLSCLLVVPILAIFIEMINGEEGIIALAAIVTFMGGFLRILYALLFQSGVPTTQNVGFVEAIKQDLTGQTTNQAALPPQQSQPVPTGYEAPPAGKWQETSDLQPTSVTENTTQILDKNDKTFDR